MSVMLKDPEKPSIFVVLVPMLLALYLENIPPLPFFLSGC